MENEGGQNPLLTNAGARPSPGAATFNCRVGMAKRMRLLDEDCCGRDGRAPVLKQLLRPEALAVFAEWKTKADKIRY